MKLDTVVPWGRSLGEYERMFDLSEADLGRRILDCAGGPASFNAELTGRGGRILSCDPLYAFSAVEIEGRIRETYPVIVAGLKENPQRYVWRDAGSPDELAALRMRAMRDFLADYPRGRERGRYVAGELPELPFPDGAFDLALCSHFLFTYSAHFPAAFHLDAVAELCRVAAEARIFPLLDLEAARSAHLDPVLRGLRARGYRVKVARVPYEFQRGGDEMLRVRAR